jgi:hypothetical protein
VSDNADVSHSVEHDWCPKETISNGRLEPASQLR